MIFRTLKRIVDNTGLDETVVKYYNTLVDELNVGLKNLSLENFGCQIVDVIIPANTEIDIAHSLSATPRYRIILRQRGNGLITDGEKPWDEKKIWMKNNSGNAVFVTIAIMRG